MTDAFVPELHCAPAVPLVAVGPAATTAATVCYNAAAASTSRLSTAQRRTTQWTAIKGMRRRRAATRLRGPLLPGAIDDATTAPISASPRRRR